MTDGDHLLCGADLNIVKIAAAASGAVPATDVAKASNELECTEQLVEALARTRTSVEMPAAGFQSTWTPYAAGKSSEGQFGTSSEKQTWTMKQPLRLPIALSESLSIEMASRPPGRWTGWREASGAMSIHVAAAPLTEYAGC